MADDKLMKNVLGYPSHFIDPAIKASPTFCKAWAEAMVNESRLCPSEVFLTRDRQASFAHLRRLSRGQQDPNQYKERNNLKKENGKPNRSYRNLNYNILKIAPKLRGNMINRVLKKDYNIIVKAMDPLAISERRRIKSQIEEFRTNEAAIDEFERISNLRLQRNVSEEQMAMTPSEIDVHVDLNPSDLTSLEIKDYLTATLALNKWGQRSKQVLGDLADLGVGCKHVFIDEVGVIRIKDWLPERTVANKFLETDGGDISRIGNFQEMTVADLKVRTKGVWGEAAYQEIAKKFAGTGQNRYDLSADKYWSDSTFSYAYDHEKVTVFTCYWFSVDQYTRMIYQNEAGNQRVKEMPYGHVPFKNDMTVNDGKGLSDKAFNEMNAGVKTIYRNEVKNVYKCSWVVDTNYVYDYGLMTAMPRYAKSLSETRLPVIVSTTDFMSPFGNVEEALDQFQLQWLQFQSHTASSRPPGIMIERNSLIKAGAKKGQAGKSVGWKELLRMYAETGSIVFDGYDNQGQPLPWFPVQEIRNGLSPGALEHFNLMLMLLDLIRTMLGINELAEGEAPPERLGKKVAELTFGASEIAIAHIHDAYRDLYEGVCSMIVDLIPDAFDKGVLPGFVETIGMESVQFFNLNRDLNLRDMGITIEEGPDEQVKERISQAIQLSIETGQLDPEDAVLIEMEKNPYRAIQMLKMKKRAKMREAEQAQRANMEYQSQMVQEEQRNAGEISAEQQDRDLQAAERMKLVDNQMAMQLEDKKFLHTFLIKKLEKGEKLDLIEQQYMRDYSRDKLKEHYATQRQNSVNATALQKQRLANKKPQPRPSTSKK